MTWHGGNGCLEGDGLGCGLGETYVWESGDGTGCLCGGMGLVGKLVDVGLWWGEGWVGDLEILFTRIGAGGFELLRTSTAERAQLECGFFGFYTVN